MNALCGEAVPDVAAGAAAGAAADAAAAQQHLDPRRYLQRLVGSFLLGVAAAAIAAAAAVAGTNIGLIDAETGSGGPVRRPRPLTDCHCC